MNKKNLVELLVENEIVSTKKQAESCMNFILDSIKKGLAEDGQVELFEFGKFELVDKAERLGRNPKTGEEIKIAPRKAVKFKTSKTFKDFVNK